MDKDIYYEASFMKKLVSDDPTLVRFYKNTVSKDDTVNSQYNAEERERIIYSVYETAYLHGLDISIELLDQYPELSQNEVFLKFAMEKDAKNTFFVQFYEGEDISVYIKAIQCGYTMFPEELERFSKNLEAMKQLVLYYPEAILSFDLFSTDEEELKKIVEVYDLACNHGFSIDEALFEEKPDLAYRDGFMYYAIHKDYHLAKYYKGNQFLVIQDAVQMGYFPTNYQMKEFSTCDELFLLLIEKYDDIKRFLLDYKGDNPIIYQKALEKGYPISRGDIIRHKEHAEIFQLFLLSDYRWIDYYAGKDPSVFIKAIELNPNYVIPAHTLERFIEDELAMKQLIEADSIYAAYYQGEDRDEILDTYHIPRSFPTDGIRFYQGDLRLFVNHYQEIVAFLQDCGVSEKELIQYLLGIRGDWVSAVLFINESNDKKQEFLLFKELYQKYNDSSGSVHEISMFMKILFFFHRYSELCTSLVEKGNLTQSEVQEIKWLYGQDQYLEEDLKPKSIEDFKMLHKSVRSSHQRHLDYNDIESVRDTICKMLFNADAKALNKQLEIYGHTIDFKKLRFNDRKSASMKTLSNEMISYTSMIEEVLDCNDIGVLRNMLIQLLGNYDSTIETSILFQDFEDKMRYLYAREIIEMTTSVSDVAEECIDFDKSNQYGVEVVDYSDRQYVLLGHVKADTESIDELAQGKSSPEHNFISLSAVSYRNQFYYGRPDRIIFGYDQIPAQSFICSSVYNMGSNSIVKANSYEVDSSKWRIQRGILETSCSSQGMNSELLCFREGLRPSCLILPNGREPTEEEIQIAKDYGLKFVITQDINTFIPNPKPISYKSTELETNDFVVDDKKSQLISLREKLLSVSSKKKKRRIAVFSDAHALFEPTLAILEDIRRKGITEIYSLGDNIGSGPNPREVLELLEEYHVQSLMGNHEAYHVDGIEKYRKHLMDTNSLSEATRNVQFARRELTDRQIRNLQLLPRVIELTFGGEKLLLCHYGRDYNSGEEVVHPENYDMVLQGHVHFKREEGNVKTLQGAGIGGNRGEAYYLILTEKDEGGFSIEVCTIPYDIENLKHDINLSELEEEDSSKINDWAKAGLKGKQ